jgi:hypothetical protein
LRCATSTTDIVLHCKDVLIALHGVTGEGDVDMDIRISAWISSHTNTVDDTVRKVEEGELDVSGEVRQVKDGGVIEYDGDGGEGLVKLRLESQSKGFSTKRRGIADGRREEEGLCLVFERDEEVVTSVENVIAVRTHSLRTIHITISGITDTSSDLAGIPASVREGLWVAVEADNAVLVPGSSVEQVIDVFAGTMA